MSATATVTQLKKPKNPEKVAHRRAIEIETIRANPHLRWRLTVFATVVAGLTIPGALIGVSMISSARVATATAPQAPSVVINTPVQSPPATRVAVPAPKSTPLKPGVYSVR